ncbi:hypothetical protein BDB01DRAFT_823580 [Pilobolus umbonatus]|nr:hypothetical protein BDB01DRAFT_827870 [Pilobolus umbonatus]KAI8968090.1 hypothetical protein BDB01DRAFT_825657 [Pilobolus umbonatus]KAI8968098.1 hypothetical protein BDB01DRAFT_825653 [Pilobolus umbonatus]KAI8968648.1 hypothetical protein BDB01DRAFT_823580 [Pilobolus umbonatus]
MMLFLHNHFFWSSSTRIFFLVQSQLPSLYLSIIILFYSIVLFYSISHHSIHFYAVIIIFYYSSTCIKIILYFIFKNI